MGGIVRERVDPQRELHDARDDRSGQAREAESLRVVDGVLVHGQVGRQPHTAIAPRGFRIPLLREFEPPHRGRNDADQAKLGIGPDRRALDTDHQVADIRVSGLQHGQARRAVGDALEHDPLDRRLLAPVLLVRLEDQLHAGAHPHESIGPETDRLALEAVLTDFLDVFPGHDPRGAGGRRGIEREEVRPGRVEHEAHAMRIDDLHGFHALVQLPGRRPTVAVEAELHVLGREGVAVVELEAFPQLELDHEAVRTLLPGLGQARRHVVAGQRLDQRVVHGVEEGERRGDARGLGRIEKGRCDRRVECDRELTLRRALRSSLPDRYQRQHEDEGNGQSVVLAHTTLLVRILSTSPQ